jgi:hypothetical protein
MQPDHVPPIERMANNLAELTQELEAQNKALTDLLKRVGDPGICKGCRAEIYWVFHRNGHRTPYNRNGTNHFTTCIHRELFRRKTHD